jgi:diguanylate cyclase (GGDEF)-like protein
MNSAVYTLAVNACVAFLFACVFAVIQVSYPRQRGAGWFCTTYLIGMLTPLSELAVHFVGWPTMFALASYGSFLVSVLMMPLGLSAVAARAPPWRAVGAILALGVVARIAIWGGTRDHILYELIYQSAFIAGAALSLYVAIRVVRRDGGLLWWGVIFIFCLIVMHFATKPFFAVYLGSGANDKAYTGSLYAIFSQSTGGVLIITAGLQILLVILATAIGRTTLDSETDPLTSIANRRGFDRQASRKIAKAQAASSPLTVVAFDLDHFKQINDRHGHATGDAVIRAFADLLRASLPVSAVIARTGGEEFVVLLDRTAKQGAWRAAEEIRRALAVTDGHLPPVTVSGGIAELQSGDTLATLLERADAWTYAAKADGRNRICPAAGASLEGLLASRREGRLAVGSPRTENAAPTGRDILDRPRAD